jgi:hypothetical protein
MQNTNTSTGPNLRPAGSVPSLLFSTISQLLCDEAIGVQFAHLCFEKYVNTISQYE